MAGALVKPNVLDGYTASTVCSQVKYKASVRIEVGHAILSCWSDDRAFVEAVLVFCRCSVQRRLDKTLSPRHRYRLTQVHSGVIPQTGNKQQVSCVLRTHFDRKPLVSQSAKPLFHKICRRPASRELCEYAGRKQLGQHGGFLTSQWAQATLPWRMPPCLLQERHQQVWVERASIVLNRTLRRSVLHRGGER